jgi:hypothetical protein
MLIRSRIFLRGGEVKGRMVGGKGHDGDDESLAATRTVTMDGART